jgi:hypothetical protein
MNSKDVRALLRSRYCAPEWALNFEVANGTGAGSSRYADAVAMNLWPSRGLKVHGFEIKVSKSDFMNEIRNPAKSSAIQKYCDFWWIVAPKEAVDESLLPPTWGWLRADKDRLVAVKDAPHLEPEPLSRTFMAAMIRRSSDHDAGEIRAIVDKQVADLRKDDEARVRKEIEYKTRDGNAAVAELAKLKAAIGVRGWGLLNTDEVVRAVRLIMECDIGGAYGGVKAIRTSLKQSIDRIDKAMAKFVGEQEKLKLDEEAEEFVS